MDTSHYSGNHSPEIELEVASVPEATNVDDLLDDTKTKWTTIVPRSRSPSPFPLFSSFSFSFSYLFLV